MDALINEDLSEGNLTNGGFFRLQMRIQKKISFDTIDVACSSILQTYISCRTYMVLQYFALTFYFAVPHSSSYALFVFV